jgi:hypothetical protein
MENEAANGVDEKLRRHAAQKSNSSPPAPHVINRSTNQNPAQPAATDRKINGGQNRVTERPESHA